ncbi:sodium/glutamate symporter [Halomonas organivorans]|uniref:ESS family glutamate:Na+ symporter n=1 Tax=Halomonas organivorans TaxID=257772 RepID=A0A7W5G5W2_9GAMM|nr:sodium/glutamate symporter [Halomonas organivorans]MBB3141317.1 ESS family glutamate:Na+ symporter [Halomonas organivorans]
MQDTFHGVIAFALLAGMLVIGGVLRNRVPLFRNMLVPSSILGGLLGFALLSLGWIPGFAPADFTALTFHFFTLSFMSLCLTGRGRQPALGSGGIVRGGIWLTLIWTISLGLQGMIGYLVIRGYDALTGAGVSAWLGALVTHGFTQGPGQALTYGGLWEDSYGIEHAAQVGLIFASLGFLVAFAVGVPLARRFIAQGLNANQASRLDDNFRAGFFAERERPEMGRMVSHPASLDSLAYHLGLLAVAYVITHCWLLFMQGLIADAQPWGINLGVLFSHNLFFLHGLGVCVLMRLVIDKAGLASYVDDESLKRITGSSVDFMVVGTLMSIQFAVLYALLTPILLVTLAVTLATLIGCLGLGRLSGQLGHERALTAFGCCCGSTGTGLLLLRMMDADFSTTVPKELAFFNLAIIVTNFHILFVFAPMVPALGGWGYLGVFGGTALAFLAMVPLMLRRRPATAGAGKSREEVAS